MASNTLDYPHCGPYANACADSTCISFYQITLLAYHFMCVLCRPDLQSSKFLIWNCAPVFVQLSDRCNILPVNTVKTVSSPPSPDLSPDNKKQEKQSRTRQKTVKVNAGISEHDLKIKMTHMSEWLEKGYHVSVLILKTSYRPEVGYVHTVSRFISTCNTFFLLFFLQRYCNNEL